MLKQLHEFKQTTVIDGVTYRVVFEGEAGSVDSKGRWFSYHVVRVVPA